MVFLRQFLVLLFLLRQEPEGLGDTEIDCATKFLYLPETFNKIDIFHVAANGALALIAGSPFTSPADNVVAVLSPDQRISIHD